MTAQQESHEQAQGLAVRLPFRFKSGGTPERPQAASKARKFRDRAAQLDAQEDMHKATEGRRRRLWAVPEVVQGFFDKGHTLDQALAAAAIETGCRPDSIAFHWTRHLRKEKQAARLKRNREILRLSRKGWPCRRIAAALNPSPSRSTVANILKHQRDEAQHQAGTRTALEAVERPLIAGKNAE